MYLYGVLGRMEVLADPVSKLLASTQHSDVFKSQHGPLPKTRETPAEALETYL